MTTNLAVLPSPNLRATLSRSLTVVGQKANRMVDSMMGLHWSPARVEAWVRKPAVKHSSLRHFAEGKAVFGVSWMWVRNIVFTSCLTGGALLVKSFLPESGPSNMQILVILSAYTAFIIGGISTELRLLAMSHGPLYHLNHLPGVLALRSALASDPTRLAVLNNVVSAVESTGANLFMDTVRRELGDEDALALALLLVCPDNPSVSRGGERDELLARVAELALSKESPALLGDNPPAILTA